MTAPDSQTAGRAAFLKSVRTYQKVDLARSVTQVVVALAGLCALYAAMIAGVHRGWYAALLLAPVTAGFLVRTFILQHDCGHGSLFADAAANRWVGRLCSVFTFTPYDHWRRHHAIHHGSWNNIATRGRLSDMYSDCITVSEYHAMSRLEAFAYRMAKNAIFALLVLPPFIFVFVYRIPFDSPKGWRREKLGVHFTSVAIIAMFAAASWAADWKSVALVVLVTLYIASVIGVWLFLVQHKFEGALWRQGASWDFVEASMRGCSLLKLPALFEWFSGHIGYHHIHHIAPGVPNYNLKPCHDTHAEFRDVKVIRLREGLSEIHRHELWDDATSEMVAFTEIPARNRQFAPV